MGDKLPDTPEAANRRRIEALESQVATLQVQLRELIEFLCVEPELKRPYHRIEHLGEP